MKIFPAFAARKIGVWYFQAEDESAYARGEACRGFGSVKYWDGAVYVGGLYFNGREYKQLGFGIQDFSESPLGQPVLFRSCRLSFLRANMIIVNRKAAGFTATAFCIIPTAKRIDPHILRRDFSTG